jgi:hypothetical protein
MMTESPRSWQGVRSVRDLRAAPPAAAAAGVQALVTGAAFHAIAPYRSFDSRQFPVRIPSGGGSIMAPWMDSTGATRIPIDVPAVSYNITVTETTGSGFVAIYPYGTDFPGVSSVNWSGNGVTVANNGTVRTGEGFGFGRHIQALVAGGGSTHFILDVTGYYA